MAGATQISQNRYIQSGNEAGNFNYQGLPPEEAVAQRALARKQQIANLLMTQGLEQAGGNNGQMVGRFYVPGSPLQNLAGLGQILAGALSSHHLDKQGEKLQNEQAAMRAQALQDYIEKTNPQQIPEHALPQGSPEVPASPGNLSEVTGDAIHAMGTPQMRQSPTGMADRLFPSAPTAEPPVDYQPPTEAQAAVPATKGPVNPAMTMQPNPMVAKVAQAQLATSTDPYLRQYAMAEAQRQAQAAEHGMNREFLSGEKALDRSNQLAMTASKIDQAMTLGLINAATGKQLKEELIAGNKDMNADTNASHEKVAGIVADAKVETAGLKQGQKGQLPVAALKMKQENLDAIGSLGALNADLKALDSQVTSGKMDLGLMKNYWSQGKNLMGISDAQSRNFATFKATLEKQRNESLRLNKGVQTEGDAVRAWDELINNINDPKVVSQRLQEITALNERGANLKRMNVDMIHQNYGLPPMDTTEYAQQPASVGVATGGVAPFTDVEKERRYQEFKANHK